MWIPEKSDRVFHVPTKSNFVVMRRRKVSGSVVLSDRAEDGNDYKLEECLPVPGSPYSVGQKALCGYDRLSDELVEVLSVSPLVDQDLYNYTVKSLEDESGKIWTVQWFHLMPYSGDRLLNPDELSTLQDMAVAIVDSGNPEELELLSTVTDEQRRQLWNALTTELRQGLKQLKDRSTQPEPIVSPATPLAPLEGLRTIVAGSRTIKDYSLVEKAILDSGFKISVVISGKEPNGVDRLGEIWAEKHGVPVESYAADWSLGKKAGPIRNRKMAKEGRAEALILIWDGQSPGSKNMLATAIELGLQIYQVNLSQQVEVVA